MAVALTSAVAPAAEPAPVPRISDVFNIPVGGMYPYDRYDFRFKVSRPAILESESMLAAGFSQSYRDNGVDYSDWKSVSFWDLSGDGGVSSKTFTSRVSAGYGSVAYKSRIFLANGSGSYRVVDRDPAVPDKSLGQGAGYYLGAISDKYIIFHTGDAYYDGTDIRFVDANTMNLVGVVRTNIRTARVAIGENEIFLASENNGTVKLHRMAMPDFTQSSVVKAKLTGVAGVYSWIEHFSANYAVVINKIGREVIVRWSDPSNGGKIRIYQSPERPRSYWFESDGQVGTIGTYPDLWVSYARFKTDGTYDLEPSGMPRGFHRLGFHSFGPKSVFVAGATNTSVFSSVAGWCHRVTLAPGRQLYIDPAVATERDGEMRFRVWLDRPSTTPVTFDYQTANRSAVAGEDFTPVAGSKTLAPGETETFISVPLLEDQAIERPEAFELQITGLSGAYCDELRTPGRIRGSGIRVLEEVQNDTSGVLATLDSSILRYGGVHTLNFPGGSVVARDHGFEQFIPIAENGGSYYYARGQKLGTLEYVLCQFDPARGELTEVFDTEAPRKRVGDRLIVKKGSGYVCYGFFDGFPAISMEGVTAVEGGGNQTLTVGSSERTSDDLSVAIEWVDAAEAPGPVSFSKLPSGDVAVHIDPEDDGKSTFDLKPSLFVTLSRSGVAETSRHLTSFTVADATAVTTTPVATTTDIAHALATSGNRLWMGQRGTALLEGMKFENSQLVPAGTVKLATGAGLDWGSYLHDGFSGQNLAFGADRIVTGYSYNYSKLGALVVSKALSTKPSAKQVSSVAPGGANLVFSNYNAVSNFSPGSGNHGTVQIFDAAGGKKVALLKAPVLEPSFGHSLAFSGNVLWISAPRPGGGKVYGYNVPAFTLATTLSSPEPVSFGAFGHSMASSDQHLIIGEPSIYSPGAAWVFTPNGGSLIKRLSSGARNGRDGFGGRVAARGGRLLVGSSTVSPELYHVALSEMEWPSEFTQPQLRDGIHQPVLLWENLDASPIPLRASCHGIADHSSGWAIGLLDDCAVFTSRGPDGGALEVHEFD